MILLKQLRSFVVLVFLFCSVSVSGQLTKIMGIVTDSQTKEALPFVNIYFKGTTIGITTDFEGKFSIESKTISDSLIASSVGYRSAAAKVFKGKFQQINFELVPLSISLNEVVVIAGENPAEILLRKINENKEKNDIREFDAYQYEVYSKIEIDINNINERFRQRRILKPFQFVFDNLDTSSINGKTYLPVFLTETLSDYYFTKDPKNEKEVIRAAKISGIENESALQFMGEVFQKYNFYENYITLFQKNFVSPVANFGLMYYKYYLVDSTFIGNKWCYKLMFKPKRKQEFTFTGNFWVHDTTFAIKSFEMKMADDANINFVNDVVLAQEFDLVDHHYWMLTKDVIVADLNVIEKSKRSLGFFGKRTKSYRNYVINQPKEPDFYKSPMAVVVSDSASKRSDEYWENKRHEELSKDELTIYHMVDTIKNLPAFKTWVDIFETVVTGYYEIGGVEFGPYMSLLSFNNLEGTRFRLGFRTNSVYSEKIRYNAHIAYGLDDDRIKYGAGLLYMFNSSPRRTLNLSYKNDIEQLGQSNNAFREDFLLAALLRRNPLDKLSMVEEYKGIYEHEWFTGFSSKFSYTQRKVGAFGNNVFIINPENTATVTEKSSINTSEIGINLRYSIKEKVLTNHFERYVYEDHYPVLELDYSYGIPGFLGSEYNFHRVTFNIRQWFNIMTIGWSRYILEAGRIFGDVPYPLLKLHEGNETYAFDEYAFNMMNYYEFVSDRYVSLSYSHHFEGFFFNRVPLLRKLKFREVVHFKGITGEIDEQTKAVSLFPGEMGTLGKPYLEAGAGIENILKIFRVDAVWRLSYLDKPNISKFGIRFSFRFDF